MIHLDPNRAIMVLHEHSDSHDKIYIGKVDVVGTPSGTEFWATVCFGASGRGTANRTS